MYIQRQEYIVTMPQKSNLIPRIDVKNIYEQMRFFIVSDLTAYTFQKIKPRIIFFVGGNF